MLETQLTLTEQEYAALGEIAKQTGKTESQVIHQAVSQFINEFQMSRLARMRKAKGLWKERDDLPNFAELRREWNRF